MFAYLVDPEHPDHRRNKALHPLSLGVRFASSSIAGRTVWHKIDRFRSVCSESDTWLEPGCEPGTRARCAAGTASHRRCRALALLYKLPTGNPAYPTKLPVYFAGKLTANGQPIDLTDAMAGIDWTRSVRLAKPAGCGCTARVTPQRQRVGLNLSALVYDDANGNSQENALWVDGKVYPLGGVQFVLPKDPRKQPWRIHSRSGGTKEVDLLFTPLGTRERTRTLGTYQKRLYQPYGTYQGTVCPTGSGNSLPVCGWTFGVVETHESVW